MYCLLQLYLCVSTELAPHRPLLKLISVKAVGGLAYLVWVVLASRSIRHLDSIFDFLASYFSILAEHVRDRQKRMTIALSYLQGQFLIKSATDTLYDRRGYQHRLGCHP
jgi:hypothetical protein